MLVEVFPKLKGLLAAAGAAVLDAAGTPKENVALGAVELADWVSSPRGDRWNMNSGQLTGTGTGSEA